MKAIKLILFTLILAAAATMHAQTQAAPANTVHPAARLSDEKQVTPEKPSALNSNKTSMNNNKQPPSVAQQNTGVKSSDDAQFNARPKTPKAIQTAQVPAVTKPLTLSDQK